MITVGAKYDHTLHFANPLYIYFQQLLDRLLGWDDFSASNQLNGQDVVRQP